MLIPRHWVRAEKEVPGENGPLRLVAWGWSPDSRTDAERHAREKLEIMARRATQVVESPVFGGYAYGTRPLREEIIREITGDAGLPVAIITRNRNGCLVLNTPKVMFIDVDAHPPSFGEWIRSLFQPRNSRQNRTLDRIQGILSTVTGASFRIYQTAGGFRIAATNRLYEPASADSEQIMNVVGADPSYIRLCRLQKSFRARLTPKPWRCGLSPPGSQHPRDNELDQARFADWLSRYELVSANKGTCLTINEVGAAQMHPDADLVLRLHDELTKASSGLPLA